MCIRDRSWHERESHYPRRQDRRVSAQRFQIFKGSEISHDPPRCRGVRGFEGIFGALRFPRWRDKGLTKVTELAFCNMSPEVFLPDYAERCSGVGDGSRTHDLLNAIQALSQLSYGLSYRCYKKSEVKCAQL